MEDSPEAAASRDSSRAVASASKSVLCLHCGYDEQGLGPACGDCGSYVGYVADGRGYLPQLKVLEVALNEGTLSPEEAEKRLERASAALETLVHFMDECGQGLMTLDWDDVQQGTLGGFMMPIREAFENLRGLVDQLDSAGNWGEETWARLNEAQTRVQVGSEGMAMLTQTLAAVAVEKGVDLEKVFAPSGGEEVAQPAE